MPRRLAAAKAKNPASILPPIDVLGHHAKGQANNRIMGVPRRFQDSERAQNDATGPPLVPANVQNELSYFEQNISPSSIPEMHSGEQHDGWTHLRKYFLSNRDGETFWKAEVTVYTKSLAVLGAFQLDHLTMETLGLTYATNWDGKMVYMYRKWQDASTYMNAIYGDMPMAGWWPWPKDPKAEGVADISASVRTLELEDKDEDKWEQL